MFLVGAVSLATAWCMRTSQNQLTAKTFERALDILAVAGNDRMTLDVVVGDFESWTGCSPAVVRALASRHPECAISLVMTRHGLTGTGMSNINAHVLICESASRDRCRET